MKRWTVDDLRAVGACDDQVALFSAMFPDGATADDLPRAVAAGLDVYWFVRRVVSPDVWAAFNRQRATLRAAFERQHAPLWAEYERQFATLLAGALRLVEAA